MIDQDLILRKANDIQKYTREMEPLLVESPQEIVMDTVKLHAVERLLQLIVDTALDINTHIIAELNLVVPDDYYSTFRTLGENKVLPVKFADRITDSVGLRNRVVHKYGEVDLKRMVREIQENIGDYKDYLKHIESFLQQPR